MLSPDQVAAAVTELGAPNNYCAGLQVYALGVLSGQAGVTTDSVPAATATNQYLAAMAPLLSGLANDTATHPPVGFPASLQPSLVATAELYARVIDELRAGGATDEMLAKIATGEGSDTSSTAGTSGQSRAQLDAYSAAVASVAIDIEAEYRSIGDRLVAPVAGGFDIDAFCPNLRTLAPDSTLGTDAPSGESALVAALVERAQAPNNFCALAQIYAIAAQPDESADSPDRLLALYAPAVFALAQDTLAHPPRLLDPAAGNWAAQLTTIFGQAVDQLAAAGVPHDVLQRLGEAANADPAVESIRAWDAADVAAVDSALVALQLDLAGQTETVAQQFGEALPADWSPEAFCQNVLMMGDTGLTPPSGSVPLGTGVFTVGTAFGSR